MGPVGGNRLPDTTGHGARTDVAAPLLGRARRRRGTRADIVSGAIRASRTRAAGTSRALDPPKRRLIVKSVEQVGRYALGQAVAQGGMATLHLGRLVGSAGFARTVAIKRLHPHLCADPSFVDAFADEARLAARIRHPNVVPTLDVVSTEPSSDAPGELLLVMEYVDGESLSALARRGKGRMPLPIVVAIVSEMLHGLHSAHEARSEDGQPLEIVHRDVSPQNVLVGADGVARLVDFGIARANGGRRSSMTGDGDLKGKLAYMAPEQVRREPVTRKTDIFAAGVVLWELLTGKRLFASDNEGATLEKILVGWVAPPSSVVRDLPPGLDEIALRALEADPSARFATAREMAVALEDALGRALGRDVAAWVEATAQEALATRRGLVASAERGAPPPCPAPDTLLSPGVRPPAASMTAEMATMLLREDASAETEGTVTTFSASNDGLSHPTFVLHTSQPPAAPPFGQTRARGMDLAALLTFAFAAAITLVVGVSYSRHGAAEAASARDDVASTLLDARAPAFGAAHAAVPAAALTAVP
ncbi:MAG: serine/threonine protein kinase, partial [Labilithrix sp.]|nr:serine/threonine protein kinase [Labilithrix sp.]